MRLVDVYRKLSEASRYIGINIVKNAGGSTYSFTNWSDFLHGIEILEETNIFKDEITIIKGSKFNDPHRKFARVIEASYDEIRPSYQKITRALPSLLEVFENMNFNQSEDLISVKLPSVNNLDDLSKNIQLISTIFSQNLLNDRINGEVKFDKFDVGSEWIDILVGTKEAVMLIAGLTWSAAVIYKKIKEGEIFKQYVKGLKIKNESLEDIQRGQKDLIEILIKSEAESVHKEFFEAKDKEQLNRITHSIKLLSELIRNGAEVHPNLSAPENVKNLFPEFKKIDLIESKQKKIPKETKKPD